MVIKLSKEEFISLVAESILKVLVSMDLVSVESDPEFVKPAKDRDILPPDSAKDNELLLRKTKPAEGEDIILIDE
jgi:hypothetical protein